MRRLATLLFLLAGCGADPCETFEPEPRALSFDPAQDAAPGAFVAWQDRARRGMREALDLDGAGATPPVAVREPDAPFAGTAILIHGHAGTAEGTLGIGDLDDRLAARGFRVVAPEVRGFGGWFGEHDTYLETLEQDAYLPLVLQDILPIIEDATTRGPVGIVGHSLGAHLALHLAALEPGVDAVLLSGLYLPTACINSDAHHRCQDHAALAERLAAEDLAMLVAPARLHVYWGEQDGFYSPAAADLAAETEARFEAVGATFSSTVAPGADHWLSPEAVIRLFDAL